MAVITMKQLLETGVHFGHQTRRWNPKMKKYIFGERNGIHIINLEQTVDLIENDVYPFVVETVKQGKSVLFVGTKKQAQEAIKEEAERCGQYYINSRWLGGTLTNFKTAKASIKRLKDMEAVIADGGLERMSKKEALLFSRELDKLNKSIGGIKDLNGLPDAIFMVDVGYHKIAVAEARALGIPVVAVVDTNHSPDGIAHIIPGNDDSGKAIALYLRGAADAILEGREQAMQGVVDAVAEDGDDEFVEVREES